MISLLGYSITAAWPALLTLFPAGAALLVYVFRRNGVRQHTTVSTLFLLRHLPKALPARRRFVPPLQFWLELIALMCLVGAAAGLVAMNAGQHIAIIIDTSLSMSANDVTAGSRFKAAIAAARGHIEASSPGTAFTVFSAGNGLRRASESESSSEQALQALSALEPGFEQDKMQASVQTALSQPQFDGVWAYTDQFIDTSNAPDVKLRSIDVAAPQLRTKMPNLWISDAMVRRRDDGTDLTATVNAVGPGPVRGRLSGACRPAARTGTTEMPLPSTSFTVQPREPINVSVRLGSENWTTCRLEVGADAPGGARDALQGDNTWWIAKAGAPQRITVVSALPPEQLGLARLAGLEVIHLPLDEYSRGQRPKGPAIFHRAAPEEVPASPALVVLPPAGNLPWGGQSAAVESKNVVVTRWIDSHPTTQHVKFPLLTIPTARPLACPDSAIETLSGTDGAITCLGEERGNKFAIVGLELFPFDGIKSPTLSVLTLNLFGWLFDRVSVLEQSSPVGPLTLPANTSDAKFELPDQQALDRAGSEVAVADHPGIVSYVEEGQGVRYMAVNFASSRESSIDELATFEITAAPVDAAADAPKALPMYLYVAAAALLILFLDIVRRVVVCQRWSLR